MSDILVFGIAGIAVCVVAFMLSKRFAAMPGYPQFIWVFLGVTYLAALFSYIFPHQILSIIAGEALAILGASIYLIIAAQRSLNKQSVNEERTRSKA